MAKLYFRYGTMSSAKTLNLLAVAHTYQQQKQNIVLIKPSLDNRFGEDMIQSRAGLGKKADILLKATQRLDYKDFLDVNCILVDEVQFLKPEQVEDLRKISIYAKVPVICYGLRTDFKSKLFPGSQRLMELADAIEEIKTTCNFCSKKAIFNMKFISGKASLSGPQVELGAEEKYLAACGKCYFNKLEPKKTNRIKAIDSSTSPKIALEL